MKNGVLNPYDPNAVPSDSIQKPLTKEEMRVQIQRAADASSFRFKMNGEPSVKTLEDGTQTADLGIINSVENTVDMEVVITLEDGTEIFKSSRLKPGQQELSGELDKTLPQGSYPASATAYALDPGTGKEIGTVRADLTFIVSKEVVNEE